MKTLYLSFSVLRRNLLAFLIVCAVMTVALALLISAVAEYRYITAARDALQAEFLAEATFFALPTDSEGYSFLPQEILTSPACETVVTLASGGLAKDSGGEYYNTTVLSHAAVQAITLPMQSGRYLDLHADAPEAVISDTYRGNLSLGDTLVLQNGTAVTLVGFVRGEMPLPDFSHWGTDMSADRLFEANNDNILVFLPDSMSGSSRPVAAVIPRADATEKERLALSEFLASLGRTVSFAGFMERTEQTIDAALREKLPLPLFLLVIATLAMISVAALAIERSMREQSRYFLLGCSKRRSMGILSLAVSAVFSLPIAVNLVLLYAFPDFLRFDADAYMLGNEILFPLLLYWGACLLLTFALTYLMYGKYSPLAFYRKNLT